MEHEDLILDFMGYKAMCHCRPIIRRLHNLRDPKIVNAEKHIDSNRPHETILDCGTLDQCYEQIFGEAVKKYNAKQKRKDRRIENYLETVLNDKRQGKHKNLKADGSRKPAYEMVIQIGNRDNRPDDEKTSAVLKDFCTHLIEKYRNIVPIGIYLHNDEFSIDEETGQKIYSPVHIHFDFVYVGHLGKSLKTGMELQCSMSGALSEMGFITTKGKGTAQTQFEESCRHDLQDFAEQHGMKIDRTPGEKHSHQEKPVYQQKKENQKKEKRLLEKEQQIEKDTKNLDENIRFYNQNVILLNEEIRKNAYKTEKLYSKENRLNQQSEELYQRRAKLDKQESDIKYRETMVNINETNNEFQREKNYKKETELKEREKMIEAGEAPLLEIQNRLDEQEKRIRTKEIELDKKAKAVEQDKQAIRIIQKQNYQTEKELQMKQNDFERDKDLFETSSLKIKGYNQICKEVENNTMTIDNVVNSFKNTRGEDFLTRLNRFVNDVKKIVTAITTELNWYKAAFKNFWGKRSQDFRQLADTMERNHCDNFSAYNQKLHNGQLDYQNEQKQQILQKHAIRQKQIDREWDRDR